MVDRQLGGVLARVMRDYNATVNARATAFNEHEDSIVVWVVGLAAASLALLAGQEELQTSAWEVRTAAACLAATIVFGLGSRLFTRAMNLEEAKRWSIVVGNLSSIELESDLHAASPELAKKAADEIKVLTDYMRSGMTAAERDAAETRLAKKALRSAWWSNAMFAGCMVCFVTASGFVLYAFFFAATR